MKTPQIELKNICKHYKSIEQDVVIFDNLNVVIPSGDFVAIMGPSGSGKTTFLNILSGVDKAQSGDIFYDQNHLSSMSESELTNWRGKNIGFIFQNYNLLSMLSAERNIELPLLLTNLSASQRQDKLKTALKLVGLETRSKHLPSQLSGGQQQRVAIARALVSSANVILCDEPTGNLDKETSREILDILRLLNETFNKTIIMVTHDPSAAALANRTLHLNNGQFCAEGISNDVA